MYSKFVCQTYGQTRAQSGDGKQDRLLINIIKNKCKKRRCVWVCVGEEWIAFGVLENCVPFNMSPRHRLIRRGGVIQRLCGPSEGRMALQHNSGDIEISLNEIRHCYENTNWDLQLDFGNNRII